MQLKFQNLPQSWGEPLVVLSGEEVEEIAQGLGECMEELKESRKYLYEVVLRCANIVVQDLTGEVKEKVKANAIVAQLVVLRLIDKELELV